MLQISVSDENVEFNIVTNTSFNVDQLAKL